MNFTANSFFVFFVIFLVLYRLKLLPKPWLITLGSFVFYAFWDWRYLGLIFVLSLINFMAGKLLLLDNQQLRKSVLVGAITFNMLILGFFKYFNFFIDEFSSLISIFGFQANLPTLQIIAPLGISFYVFQITSYVVDVYRGEMQPTESFAAFTAFASYFPHMAAGPIMPAKLLIPQIESTYDQIPSNKVISGLALFANGLFRKVVIADTLAPFVNRVFNNPGSFNWQILLAATVGFGLQIYGDFSGYSNMARGVSRILGIELIINFRQPYFANNIQTFWRSWHISLSNWFRDYLYIPMGGSRSETITRTIMNLVIVMTIAGLWHGASTGFVIWGLCHGLALALYHIWKSFREKKNLSQHHFFGNITSIVVTNVIVFLLWIPFRLPETNDWRQFLSLILSKNVGVGELPDFLLVAEMLIIVLALDLTERIWILNLFDLREKIVNRPKLLGFLVGMLFIVAFIFRSSEVIPFVYFQF